MSIQTAEAKWERNTHGNAWKSGVQAAESANAYCRGLAESLGVPESQCQAAAGSRWRAGVDAVSAAAFDSSIAGKGPKWARRTVAGLTRA